MVIEPLHVARLSEGATDADGATVRFRIEAVDGRTADLSCDQDQIESLIHFLAGLGQISAYRRPAVTPHQFGPEQSASVP